ncbi:L-threonylcarbamoyladenylate synthase [Bombilactobacillus thymidiniphilus]|uniref:Threonylcarbamoyl-AMP synthase n=1 Tax=Bombilactobacillus thymidiniphilus TaxID=2923363 RepID=A0ABY4PDU3_9LACO|nr:L-threonylcarbamoyladenylate synthase [Bombilactobacillus thymidiniphilus]UQS83849.1 threonylcarbamoyl-AMP synthase [Bombilactobacillus thymidiniphilus]
MKTEIFTRNDLTTASELLANGQLVAFPTETVYGLGADATNELAVKQVYVAKGRPSDNPLIVHVNDPEMVWNYADLNWRSLAQKLMQAFWPGPLTIILPIQDQKLSTTVTGGLKTAAFRMPDNALTLQLITQLNRPLVGPSANTSGKPSPTEAMHVYHDLNGKIAGIVDDGPTLVGLESTVLDLTSSIPTILRPGALTREQIQAVIGQVQDSHHQVQNDEIPKAPGMKYKHYAPNAQVVVIDRKEDFLTAIKQLQDKKTSFAVMATDDVLNNLNLSSNLPTFSLGDSVVSASKRLFAGLRRFDMDSSIEYILAQGTSDLELGKAYMNRLNKAAGQQHFKLEEQ